MSRLSSVLNFNFVLFYKYPLKGVWHETFKFFHESVFSGHLSITLGPFQFFSKNECFFCVFPAVFRIWIRRIRNIFCFPDPLVVRYGSGSGSFYDQTKLVRKTLIFTVWRILYDSLSLKNDVNVPSKRNNQKINFLLASWRSLTKEQVLDPYQNVTNREHWFPPCKEFIFSALESFFLLWMRCSRVWMRCSLVRMRCSRVARASEQPMPKSQLSWVQYTSILRHSVIWGGFRWSSVE